MVLKNRIFCGCRVKTNFASYFCGKAMHKTEMEYTARYITDDIKLSWYEDKFFKSDVVFDCHMLVWFISGETKIIQAEKTYFFKTGDIFLIPRNQLATIINYPKEGQPHKTVTMHLTKEMLRNFYEKKEIPKTGLKGEDEIRVYKNHPLLLSCMASLIPYFLMEELPENIATLKINEAINVLREIDKGIDDVLSDFEEPGKIDLAGFMERNFMYNMPLERMGYLTGRSLSTFNRDFKKLFRTTPQRWLVDKRLDLAHYKLAQKNKKPIEVYLEVGFEDLSHFSFAFKKKYGYSPAHIPLADAGKFI